MNLGTQQHQETMVPASGEIVPRLVSDHLHPLFVFINSFIEDPTRALELTQSVFRAATSGHHCDTVALYREACSQLAATDLPGSLRSLMNRGEAICWLLKEIGGLGYNEIAAVISISRDDVGRHISTARSALLAFA